MGAGRKNHLLAEAILTVSVQLTGHAMTLPLRNVERWINDGDRPREPLPGIVAA